MKRYTLMIFVMLLIVPIALAACGGQEEGAQPKTGVTAEDVKEEATEAMETAAAYTAAQKEDYLKQIDARLEAMDREIEALGSKIQAGTDELKAESGARLNDALATLRVQKAAAAEQYQALKSSSGEAWSDLKAGMDAAMEDMNAAFEEARSEFE